MEIILKITICYSKIDPIEINVQTGQKSIPGLIIFFFLYFTRFSNSAFCPWSIVRPTSQQMVFFKIFTMHTCIIFLKRQILGSFKLKEFADDSFKCDENGRKFSKKGRQTLWEKEKLLVTSNFSFSHCVFKRLVKRTLTNKGLFGKGINTVKHH